MSTWNKRAVQGALIRLDQTGMVKRFRARRKDAEDNWLTCIEVLREPRPQDHDNLKFRRQATMEETADEQLDEDEDGETMMRDLEVDMLNNESQEADGSNEDTGRIPPQWVPERLLSNTLHEVIALGGSEGWDSGVLRDRIVGKFWRRPMESYLTRLTDDWENTQPPHIRHLALIRDTRNTQEKKFVHYVYRTYENFQKAVDAGEVIWAGVSKPAPKQPSTAKGGRPKKNASVVQPVDSWGFRTLTSKDFLSQDGSASLSECRTAIVHGRKYGPRWDNLLTDDIGYQKIETPKAERPKWTNDMSRSRERMKQNLTALATPRSGDGQMTPMQQLHEGSEATESDDGASLAMTKIMGIPKRKQESGLLTVEQRIALGLKPKGRISKIVEDQIREHRKRTGDPISIPDSVEHETPDGTLNTKHGPLMTKEERIAKGLPARGRLGQEMEDRIREERGLPKSVEKVKKPRNRPTNEPALLSKQQRIAFGIIPHGRLPQALMEGLREERELDISLEQSRVLQAYLNAVKENKGKDSITHAINVVRAQLLQQNEPSQGSFPKDNRTPVPDDDDEPTQVVSGTSTPHAEKRKANDSATALQPSKRMRVQQDASPRKVSPDITPPSAVSAIVEGLPSERTEKDDAATAAASKESEVGVPAVTGSLQPSGRNSVTPSRPVTTGLDVAEVDPQVLLVRRKYDSRSDPGVYFDPFAKRKVIKGRPRNAFIATFKLGQLTEFDWFKDDATRSSIQLEGNELQHITNDTVACAPSPPMNPQQLTNTGDGSLEYSNKNNEQTGSPKTVPEVHLRNTEDDESIRVGGSPAPRDATIAVRQTDAQSTPVQEPTIDDTLNQSNEASRTSGQRPDAGYTAQRYARPVASWNAINIPSQPQSTYQSPYALSGPPEPTPLSEQAPVSEVSEQPVLDSADEPQIQGVCGPITEADTLSKNARKLAAYMGTKSGGGSQKIFRHQIIMQIIEICNGVYPMHGEIGRPFVTLWKQQHPEIPPPNSSTVLSNLRDMIADQSNGLKKFSFLIRLRQSAGLKKKDMVVYQHLTPTSPQVTRLAYKMANCSNTKAHQYYPDEIRHLISDESFYVPMPVAPKDETISLERLNPSLDNKIKEANLERRRRYYHKQKNEDLARDAQNAAVEAPSKQAVTTDGQPRAKRTRLASLNDKNKRYRRAPLTKALPEPLDEEAEALILEGTLAIGANRAGQTLIWKEPWVAPVVRPDTFSPSSKTPAHIDVCASQSDKPTKYYISSIGAPIIRFYATNGTFSTEFGLVRESDLIDGVSTDRPITDVGTKPKGKKRVRIVEPQSKLPNKRVRLGTVKSAPIAEAIHVDNPRGESEDSDSSSTSSSLSLDEDDHIPVHEVSKKTKVKAKAKAKAKTKTNRSGDKKTPLPTLLERLTGLTGDPCDPIYQPPKPKAPFQKKYKGWSERKKASFAKQQRERKYAESQDPLNKFKKLCCTLVIASSMTGANGHIDWSIVEKVQNKAFDLSKTKALWAWMQTNMASQIAQLTVDFETRFLQAYESGRIATIEDPATYDWANLVRWAMHTCIYPELSLPVYREALQHFIVDLSSFEVLDRPRWYRENIADRVRTQLQLQYPFTAPLHRSHNLRSPINVIELKARSWIRANTATPQAIYDSKTAHEKLKTLGDPVLAKVVGEYVNRQMLRMRRLKRLLPGRNYTFTARLAKKYGRTLELGDFMAAVKIKKEMDAAFAKDEVNKRIYSISRAEPDGAIMAVMSLLSEGKVEFVPKLPSVNNKFGAPLPRLSVWGFMEGDYVHRGIDRQRLFWDIHVIPTSAYNYGNPLQPSSGPSSQDQTNESAAWFPLPQPPLPGKHDSNALLPIWSSMDGQSVTWPWWYRILNLVLQPLIFQPGAAVEEIYANCDELTTEIFEIELVLQWLVSVNAIRRTIGGGYITTPSVWAVFGDILHDMDDDWLDAHVKRKQKRHEKQQWPENHHLRYSVLQGRNDLRDQSQSDDSDESDLEVEDGGKVLSSTSKDILRHSNTQHAIVRDQVATRTSGPPANDAGSADTMEQTVQLAAASGSGDQDVDMEDTTEVYEVDAEGGMDV